MGDVISGGRVIVEAIINFGKAVIFDMDGVLSDSEWIYVDKILEVLRDEGVIIRAEEINDLFGRNILQIAEELKKRYHLPGAASDYSDRVLELRDRHIREEGLFPMDGAVDLVCGLHEAGISIAVASSASLETIRGNMRRFGIENFIDFFVSGHDCTRGKPDPEIYQRAASLLGVEPGESIAVEYSANGVAAAKAAGMYCIAFVPPKAVPQDVSIADVTVSSLREIKMKFKEVIQ